jgi:signal transduction histidine kinase
VSGVGDLGGAVDALSDVINSAMRVSEIVQRERRLLRKSQWVVELVDVNDALREVELFIRAEARQCGVRVTLALQPGLPAVPGTRVPLQQVALNLAHNGLQAMAGQSGGAKELIIRTESGTGEVNLSVTDSGPPVDDLLLERMFEPFYTTKPTGLGMGLSISKSIILDGHRGRIWPTRNPGGGLTLHVALPRK